MLKLIMPLAKSLHSLSLQVLFLAYLRDRLRLLSACCWWCPLFGDPTFYAIHTLPKQGNLISDRGYRLVEFFPVAPKLHAHGFTDELQSNGLSFVPSLLLHGRGRPLSLQCPPGCSGAHPPPSPYS